MSVSLHADSMVFLPVTMNIGASSLGGLTARRTLSSETPERGSGVAMFPNVSYIQFGFLWQ
jgi:hypothetical protein